MITALLVDLACVAAQTSNIELVHASGAVALAHNMIILTGIRLALTLVLATVGIVNVNRLICNPESSI